MHGELKGTGWGPSTPVYAQAALLHEANGRLTLSPDLLADAFRRFKRGEDERDIVLVAEDAAVALLVSLPPGLMLCGVVAEADFPASAPPPALPVVAGAAGARETIAEGDLLILDRERGRVLIEPDAEEFALIQADRRRPRVWLGESHLEARTQTGRPVFVWASIQNESELPVAVGSGADGLLIRAGGSLLPIEADTVDEDASDDPPLLLQVAAAFGGGNIAIRADPDDIDPAILFAMAEKCQLRWVVSLQDLPFSPKIFRDEIAALYREYADEQTAERRSVGAMPFFAAWVHSPDSENEERAGLQDWEMLFVLPDVAQEWTVADTFGLPPIYVVLNKGLDALPMASALGAAGLVVAPEHVAEVKDFIRAQSY